MGHTPFWWATKRRCPPYPASNNGNHGTEIGGVGYANGVIGQAVNFDGEDDYISLGNPASLKLTESLTISAWINLKDDLSNPGDIPGHPYGQIAVIVSKWGQGVEIDSYTLVMSKYNGNLGVGGAIGDGSTPRNNPMFGFIQPQTWMHVTMTYTSTAGLINFYINGQPVGSYENSGGIFTSNKNVLIGREDSVKPRYFPGLIDEVRIYHRTLSESEIGELYQLGSEPTKTYEDGLNEGIAKCKNDPASCEITIPPESGNCSADIAAIISEDLSLHISKAQYNTLTGTQILWIDLTFGGANEAGDLTWILSDYGEVE